MNVGDILLYHDSTLIGQVYREIYKDGNALMYAEQAPTSAAWLI